MIMNTRNYALLLTKLFALGEWNMTDEGLRVQYMLGHRNTIAYCDGFIYENEHKHDILSAVNTYGDYTETNELINEFMGEDNVDCAQKYVKILLNVLKEHVSKGDRFKCILDVKYAVGRNKYYIKNTGMTVSETTHGQGVVLFTHGCLNTILIGEEVINSQLYDKLNDIISDSGVRDMDDVVTLFGQVLSMFEGKVDLDRYLHTCF